MICSIQSEKHTFAGSTGALLDARIDRPQQMQPRAYVVMSHCFTCTKETLTAARVARGLAQRGYGVLRFDFTGLGGSEGEFADSNFSSMVGDIVSAAGYLRMHYQAPLALLGHSMGGTASLAASQQIATCKTVITLASPSQPAHVLHHFGPVLQQLEAGASGCITVAGMSYPVKPQFVQDVRRFSMAQAMTGCALAVLAIRAGNDELVKPRDADEIVAYTRGQNRVVEMSAADHLFTDRETSQGLIDEIAGWLNAFAA